MTHPQSVPQSLDAEMLDLQARLRALVDPPRAGPPTPRPVVSEAGAGAGKWGPSAPRAAGPLAVLAEVVDHAHSLQRLVLDLLSEVTGEQPIRSREVPRLPNGLLPAIAALAAEIDLTHAAIGQAVQHLRARL